MLKVIDLAPARTGGLAVAAAVADVGAVVAARLGAEAATLAHGFAGAVLLAALATRPAGRPIVMARGHDIEIAGPLSSVLALAGARPVTVGSVDHCTEDALEAALDEGAAAAFYVVDGRLADPLMPLPAFRHAAKRCRVPTVVLARTTANAEGLLDAGADLLVIDAASSLAGPPLGIVAGGRALVAAAGQAQVEGIGRLARPAPEHLEALLAILGRDDGGVQTAERARAVARLGAMPGLEIVPDGRDVTLKIDPAKAGFSARDLAVALGSGDPAVILDDSQAHAGRLALDIAGADAVTLERAFDTMAQRLAAGVPKAPWP